eukprot:1184610-Prorocentrum_minimum.AAC.1
MLPCPVYATGVVLPLRQSFSLTARRQEHLHISNYLPLLLVKVAGSRTSNSKFKQHPHTPRRCIEIICFEVIQISSYYINDSLRQFGPIGGIGGDIVKMIVL